MDHREFAAHQIQDEFFSESQKLLEYLDDLVLLTGRLEVFFVNDFLREAIQLLKNSISLYRNGYFDCSFYSIRQANELFNIMLYLANNDRNELKKWIGKERFPMDAHIVSKLHNLSAGYREMNEALHDYFEYHKNLLKKVNKIIHKQGFDTFYSQRSITKYDWAKEEKLFLETLKYTLGKGLIMFLILEPFSLALADDSINRRIHFNLITEPIDCSFFEKFLGLYEVIKKLLNTNYYKSFISWLQENEPMNETLFQLRSWEYWDIDNLEKIESQIHLLTLDEMIMLKILKLGVRVLNFYFNDGLIWYVTSYEHVYSRSSFGPKIFEVYYKNPNKYNQNCEGIYLSIFDTSDGKMIFEHIDKLNRNEIEALKNLEKEVEKDYLNIQFNIDK